MTDATPTPHYQELVDKLGKIYTLRDTNPELCSLEFLQELSVMATTVLPRLTPIDIAAIGDKKYNQIVMIAAASDKAINDLATTLKGEMTNLRNGSETALTNLSNQTQQSLSTLAASKTQLLETEATSKVALIDTAKTNAIAELTTAKNTGLAALAAAGVGSKIEKGMIFADFARYHPNSSFAFTSDDFALSSAGHMERIFQLIMGRYSGRNIPHFRHPKKIIPFTRSQLAVGITEDYNRYANSSNNYNYPHFQIGVLFVKNTTDAAITKNLNFGYSSYGNNPYSTAQLFTVTPNQNNDDRANIDDLTYNQIWNYTSSTASVTNAQITVPANTTIAVILVTSDYYYTSSNGYQFQKQLVFYGLPGFFTSGLELDSAVMNAAFNKDLSTDHEMFKAAA